MSITGAEALSSFKSYKYRPLEAEDHIRLLCFNKSAMPRDLCHNSKAFLNPTLCRPLHFDIRHVSLKDNPKFDAVSYGWKSPMKSYSIRITDNQHLSIANSIANALPHLTNKSRIGCLWIDQICTNQESILERNHQVLCNKSTDRARSAISGSQQMINPVLISE